VLHRPLGTFWSRAACASHLDSATNHSTKDGPLTAPHPLIVRAIHTWADSAAMDVEDDDPVVAEYDVYITPDVDEQQLYVLQYLNRPPDQPLTKATESQPSQLRVKTESGFIEVDVPINIYTNYSRIAGVRWGEAMRKTKGFGQKAFGIASGFERAMPRASGRPGPDGAPPPRPAALDDDDNLEEYVTHFEDANEKGHVLNSQTFGGQIISDNGKGPSYMLGTFRDGRQLALVARRSPA